MNKHIKAYALYRVIRFSDTPVSPFGNQSKSLFTTAKHTTKNKKWQGLWQGLWQVFWQGKCHINWQVNWQGLCQ